MRVNSDFIDYYDNLVDNTYDDIIYNRYISKSMARGRALKYLNKMGITTIELNQVSDFSLLDKEVVVYTDIYGHNGKGKQIMAIEEALKYNSNCLASKFYITDGKTIKYLQIGKRRYYITYKKDNIHSLEIGNIIDIYELSQSYNNYIKLPIFSIDYISVNGNMMATDFNEYQNMKLVGLDKIISAEDVIQEIKLSIQYYKN